MQSKKDGKDEESIQSSTTPDPGYQWESDNVTIRHHKESQEVSPFPAGEHKAITNRRACCEYSIFVEMFGYKVGNLRRNVSMHSPQSS